MTSGLYLTVTGSASNLNDDPQQFKFEVTFKKEITQFKQMYMKTDTQK
jgi:hypothetical protein